MNAPIHPIQPFDLLDGYHRRHRCALIGPGPSLDEYGDRLLDLLEDYDVRFGISEAGLAIPTLDYLSCFDRRAIPKTQHAWRPGLRVLVMEDCIVNPDWPDCYGLPHPEPRIHAGSLGFALYACLRMGFSEVDLFGIDLCWRGKSHRYGKYASGVMDVLDGSEIAGGTGMTRCPHPADDRLRPERDLWADHGFTRQAQNIAVEHEAGRFDPMKITNRSSISQLRCFPREPL